MLLCGTSATSQTGFLECALVRRRLVGALTEIDQCLSCRWCSPQVVYPRTNSEGAV
jgi:hypothetical protein